MTPKRHAMQKIRLASPRKKEDDDYQRKSQAFRYVKRRQKLCRDLELISDDEALLEQT